MAQHSSQCIVRHVGAFVESEEKGAEGERAGERETVVDETGNHVDDCIRVKIRSRSFLMKIQGPDHPGSAVHLLDTRGGSRAVCVAFVFKDVQRRYCSH